MRQQCFCLALVALLLIAGTSRADEDRPYRIREAYEATTDEDVQPLTAGVAGATSLFAHAKAEYASTARVEGARARKAFLTEFSDAKSFVLKTNLLNRVAVESGNPSLIMGLEEATGIKGEARTSALERLSFRAAEVVEHDAGRTAGAARALGILSKAGGVAALALALAELAESANFIMEWFRDREDNTRASQQPKLAR